jgi:hypothetical protein
MDMPIMRPIPIHTKGIGPFKKIWRWMTSVRQWEIIEDYRFNLDGVLVIIPKGFVFDGASIPRPLWAILSPTGLLFIPGLLHDFGYRYNYLLVICHDGTYVKYMSGRGKLFWDKVFYRASMIVNGVNIVSSIAFLALVLFGGHAWRAWRTKNKMHAK